MRHTALVAITLALLTAGAYYASRSVLTPDDPEQPIRLEAPETEGLAEAEARASATGTLPGQASVPRPTNAPGGREAERTEAEHPLPFCPVPVPVYPGDGEAVFTNPVTFQWSAAPGALSYELAWDGVPGQRFVRRTGIEATAAMIQRVQNPRQTVYWQVRARCSGGVLSAWSPERRFVMR